MALPLAHRHIQIKAQSGTSLVELMVSLVIGLLVVLVALGTLASTRTASRAVDDSTRLQQDATTVFRIMGRSARQAGAWRLIDTATGSGRVVFNTAYTGIADNPTPWQPIWIMGTDGEGTAPDTLTIHRDSQAQVADSVDCIGEASTDLNGVRDTFSVDNGMLRCDGSGPTQGALALISGVEDLQVWYGLRQGGGLRYVTASELAVLTPARWNQVESVRICLRLVGELTDNPGAATTGCQAEPIANDGRLRRVFFRVFKLRNVDA